MELTLKQVLNRIFLLGVPLLFIWLFSLFSESFFTFLNLDPNILQLNRPIQFTILNLYVVYLCILSWYSFFKNFDERTIISTLVIPYCLSLCVYHFVAEKVVQRFFFMFNYTNNQILFWGICFFITILIIQEKFQTDLVNDKNNNEGIFKE